MAEASHELGLAEEIHAESFGRPGERTFRLRVAAQGGDISLWMEKEQLSQLALAVQQVLAGLEAGGHRAHRVDPNVPAGTGRPNLEFKAGKLALRFEEVRDLFAIVAHDVEEDQEGMPTVVFWSPREVMGGLAEEALEICASGRPICPLCHGPMNAQGHMCVKGNGHRATASLEDER